jgi:hypothetical protein
MEESSTSQSNFVGSGHTGDAFSQCGANDLLVESMHILLWVALIAFLPSIVIGFVLVAYVLVGKVRGLLRASSQKRVPN